LPNMPARPRTHTHLVSTCAPPAISQTRVPARSPAVTRACTMPSSHACALSPCVGL
ncbi:hypothetical protein FIBSPDRAFT_869940, partial [Athelia psychrophila]